MTHSGVGAEVGREWRVLTDDVAFAVGDTGGEVVGLADDGGESGAEDSGLHLSDDAVEPCTDDFLRDDVCLCHGAMLLVLRCSAKCGGCMPLPVPVGSASSRIRKAARDAVHGENRKDVE